MNNNKRLVAFTNDAKTKVGVLFVKMEDAEKAFGIAMDGVREIYSENRFLTWCDQLRLSCEIDFPHFDEIDVLPQLGSVHVTIEKHPDDLTSEQAKAITLGTKQLLSSKQK